MLVILSGVSGAWKDTIKKELLKRMPNAVTLPSFTSRDMRPGEVEGDHYHFISKEEFEEKININDIDLRNASYVEMSALEAYYDVDRGNGLSSFPEETGHMGLNERCDLISSFEKVIRDMNKLGRYDLQMFYMRNMNTYLNANSKHK